MKPISLIKLWRWAVSAFEIKTPDPLWIERSDDIVDLLSKHDHTEQSKMVKYVVKQINLRKLERAELLMNEIKTIEQSFF